MAKSTHGPLPKIEKALARLGERMRLARLRRGLSSVQVSERAGITRPTLKHVEQGFSGVSLGIYAKVLMVLGLEDGIDHLAKDDDVGRKLQDIKLSEGRSKTRGQRD